MFCKKGDGTWLSSVLRKHNAISYITIRPNFQEDEELVAFDQAQSALLSWIADCGWLQKISCIIEREMCGTFLTQLREI